MCHEFVVYLFSAPHSENATPHPLKAASGGTSRAQKLQEIKTWNEETARADSIFVQLPPLPSHRQAPATTAPAKAQVPPLQPRLIFQKFGS
ncbi:hypothetical protein V9T40_004363 [Parthenolecanium corni]|uniref:Uncharacterized protein n=1 Tax=Parthenolecanium corni TaxID=536013 RepID=A0AAN9TWG7_9HEMI